MKNEMLEVYKKLPEQRKRELKVRSPEFSEICEILDKMVFFEKLFTNKDFYEAVERTLCDIYQAELDQ